MKYSKHILYTCTFSTSLFYSSTASFSSSADLKQEYSNLLISKLKTSDLELKEDIAKKHKRADQENILPDEMLVHIFSTLPFYDIVRCSQVNRLWHEAYVLLLTSSYKPAFCQYLLAEEMQGYWQVGIDERELVLNHLLIIGISASTNVHGVSGQEQLPKSKPTYHISCFNDVYEGLGRSIFALDKLSFCIDGVEQDYQLACRWYEKTSVCNQASAQYNLGFMYKNGRGVSEDYQLARQWYEKAAAQNHASAQFKLGCMYVQGQGGEQDDQLARQWYEKAAAQNHVNTQFNLGLMYDQGQGVEQDYLLARQWYEKAAAQNHADAQYNLGYMYAQGEGGEQDDQLARQWYEKAAAQNHTAAQDKLKALKKD